MKYFVRLCVLLLVFILLPFLCPAAEKEGKESKTGSFVYRDKITQVKFVLEAANGKPQIKTLQLDYPPLKDLVIEVSLTVKKGSYKIELLEDEKPFLTVVSQEGKTVKASGRMIMSEEGVVQYKVTAKKAKNIAFDLSFAPYLEGLRTSRAYTERNLPPDNEGITLNLTCVAGRDCLLQVQNLSRTKAFRNIVFQIDYKLMAQAETAEKSRGGTIEDVLLPGKTAEWSVGLVFGEPPKDMKISFIGAESVDPAQLSATAAGGQKKNTAIEVLPIAPLSGQPVSSGNQAK